MKANLHKAHFGILGPHLRLDAGLNLCKEASASEGSDEGWGQATGNAYCVASTQEGGMIHAAMAAPASMPNANTLIAIISLAVRLSTDRVSSSSAVGGRSIMGATIANCLITFPSFRPSCHSEIPQETIARTIEVLRKHGVCSVGALIQQALQISHMRLGKSGPTDVSDAAAHSAEGISCA